MLSYQQCSVATLPTSTILAAASCANESGNKYTTNKNISYRNHYPGHKMVETKLLVNVGLKIVFGSLMSLPVTVMLHVSPPGNDMVSWTN